MFNDITNLINLLMNISLIGGILYYGWRFLKSSHLKNGLQLALEITKNVVPKYALDTTTPSAMRKQAVIREVNGLLAKRGYHINLEHLAGIAERVYQIYKANGGNIATNQNVQKVTKDAVALGNDTKNVANDIQKATQNTNIK